MTTETITRATMADGTIYGMTENQERMARESGLYTNPQDNGLWGWSSIFGEDWDFISESQAWAAGLQAAMEQESVSANNSASG